MRCQSIAAIEAMVFPQTNVRSPPMRWTTLSLTRRIRKGWRRRRSLRGHVAIRRQRRRPRPSSFRNSDMAAQSNWQRRTRPIPVVRECQIRGDQAPSVERSATSPPRAAPGWPEATVCCPTIACVHSPNHRRRPLPTTSVAKGSDSNEEEQGESAAEQSGCERRSTLGAASGAGRHCWLVQPWMPGARFALLD